MEYKWPPVIPELGDLVKSYIDQGKPLSIPDESGIIKKLEQDFISYLLRKNNVKLGVTLYRLSCRCGCEQCDKENDCELPL